MFSTDAGKLFKIYKVGKEKIDKDLNIINVLNRMRFYQISLLNKMKKDDVWKSFYNDYNVIDINESNFSSTDSDGICTHNYQMNK